MSTSDTVFIILLALAWYWRWGKPKIRWLGHLIGFGKVYVVVEWFIVDGKIGIGCMYSVWYIGLKHYIFEQFVCIHEGVCVAA